MLIVCSQGGVSASTPDPPNTSMPDPDMLDPNNLTPVPKTALDTRHPASNNPLLIFSRRLKHHQQPQHNQPLNPEADPSKEPSQSENNTITRMDDLDWAVPIAL